MDAYNYRTNNATIEVIIEEESGSFNNSLAGSLNCPNAYTKSSGDEPRNTWMRKYLKDGTALQAIIIRCTNSLTCTSDSKVSGFDRGL
jgi:hypothetical protein